MQPDLIDETTTLLPTKPSTVHELSIIFKDYMIKFREPPAGLDHNPVTAAKQWVQLQDPPGFSEHPQLRKTPKSQFWKTPYLDRLRKDLRKFMMLNRTDQQTIVDAKHQQHITWRGEDMDMFRKLLEHCIKTG